MRIIDNFWNSKRKEYGLSIGDVAKIMNVSKSTASSYLAGVCMPSKDKIFALCAYCNVDVATGTHEFSKAYNTWEKHHPGYVRNGNSYTKAKKTTIIETPLYVPELKEEVKTMKYPNKSRASRMHDVVNNFWTQKKVESGLSYNDIAQALNMPMTSTRNFFTGRMSPDDKSLSTICELLGVDVQEGRDEFAKLRKKRKANAASRAHKKAAKKTATEVKTEAPVAAAVSVPDYLESLYGKISFKDFTALCSGTKSKEDVLPFLYGNVDYDTFCKIFDTL